MCKNVIEAMYHCRRIHRHSEVVWVDDPVKGGHYFPSNAREKLMGSLTTETPLCEAYAFLLEWESRNPPVPKTQRPPHIQRLKSKSRNNQIPFTERFEYDFMGNSYFEQGECAARIKEMADLCEFGKVRIGNHVVLFAFNPNNYNELGAAETIKAIFDRKQNWWIEEDPYFDAVTLGHVAQALKDRKKWTQSFITTTLARSFLLTGPRPPCFHSVDAWFDIRYGLFWTIDKVNIRDVQLNFIKSKQFWEHRRKTAQA